MESFKQMYNQMLNDQFDGVLEEKELVLIFLQKNILSLLYMTEQIQKDPDFKRQPVKTNRKAIAWDVYDRAVKETVLEAIKHRDGFQFLKQKWQKDEEFVKTFPDNVCYTGYNF